jgi:site-specific recombinase XerD
LAFNRTVVTRYRIALEQRRYAPSTISLRLAAVRRLAYEASECGLLSPDLAAGIRRVKRAKRLGVRIGNWLSADQGKALVATPAGLQLRVVRDRAVLAMLIGCGLRRAELVAIKVEDFERREDHWVLADLIGKGKPHADCPSTSMGQVCRRCLDPLSEIAERGSVSRYRKDRKGLGFRVHFKGDLADRPSSSL